MPISMVKVKTMMDKKGYKKNDLRKAGVNGSILDKVLGGTLSKQKRVDTETISKLCKILECQPADIMEYVEKE